jgi:predicted aspartyl protease
MRPGNGNGMAICWRATGLLAVGLIATALGAYDQSIESLYEANQWFQLREAVRNDPTAPPFYRGVAALAFHDWETAEHQLNLAAESAPRSVNTENMDLASQAALALDALTDLYSLTGRYKEAAEAMDRFERFVSNLGPDARIAKESARVLRSYRALYSAAGHYPNQAVVKRGYSQMLYSASYGRPVVRLSIGSRTTSMMLDTGSGANFINPSEARRLGLAVHSVSVPLDAYDGAKEKTSGVAIADELTVGNFQVRNVAFFVLSEDDPETPGILGLPMLFALGTVRWSADGTIEIGFPSNSGDPNLAYNGNGLLIEASVGRETLLMSLDTGADETLVYPLFARALSGALGRPMGKQIDRSLLTARALKVRTAGFEAMLGNANLAMTQRRRDFEGLDGNLGLDILEQGSSVTLDFTAMRLRVEPGAEPAGYLGGKPLKCALPAGFVCQSGYTCTVWLDKEDPCMIDRVTPGVAGGSTGKAPNACVIPESFTCGNSETCSVWAGSNGICNTARNAAHPSTSPAATTDGVREPASGPTAPLSTRQGGVLTPQEIRDLMRASVEEDNLNFEPSRNYVYTEDKETRFLDAKGNITDSNSETHESIVLYGERYERLIRRDSKPLPPKQEKAEQEKLDRETARRAKETPEARAKRLFNDNKRDMGCANDFISAFDFKLTGVEAINGRPAWGIEATPATNAAVLRCDAIKRAKAFHLRIWVDQADKSWSKVEADNLAPVTWGAVLVRVPAGSLHVSDELTRREDGVWLPAYLRVRIDVKLILLKTVRMEIVSSYSNYRKFQADSRIVE